MVRFGFGMIGFWFMVRGWGMVRFGFVISSRWVVGFRFMVWAWMIGFGLMVSGWWCWVVRLGLMVGGRWCRMVGLRLIISGVVWCGIWNNRGCVWFGFRFVMIGLFIGIWSEQMGFLFINIKGIAAIIPGFSGKTSRIWPGLPGNRAKSPATSGEFGCGAIGQVIIF